ncbi:hypothetical protein ScPMuIL_015615, partial [Solemya velum]
FDGIYCNRTWDDLLCWPDTKAGTVAVQPCPPYIHKFNTKANATKMCLSNGTWYYHPLYNRFWTNFSQCYTDSEDEGIPEVPALIEEHMPDIKMMYNVGYGLSLASLLLAVSIMLYFRKLHCSRNIIHLNLFLSFILRAMISFAKEYLLVDNVGFAEDVMFDYKGKLRFNENVSHWKCRLFFTIYNYINACSYMWIFVEGLYLQMLISVSVFADKKRTKWYMALGWTFPLTFTIPWAIVRSTLDNVHCWNTSSKPEYLWIYIGPICTSIIINFIFFINIVRILFTKLNASPCPETKKFRYRRLARSTLILIPLFGVYYLVFTIANFELEATGELVMMYAEMFFNSFQGLVLASLFCFLNMEVQAEIKKWRHRNALRRGSSAKGFSVLSTYLSRAGRSHGGGRRSPTSTNGLPAGRIEYGTNDLTGGEHIPFKKTLSRNISSDIESDDDMGGAIELRLQEKRER